MILVRPSFEVLRYTADPLLLIESAGRTCYKSEDLITNESSEKFCKMLVDKGHESVIEHASATVKLIVDRGVSHELVRHRLVSYSQESTRYCNYRSGVTFVIPPWVNIVPGEYTNLYNHKMDSAGWTWANHLLCAEETYLELLAENWSPQQARSVLPNSLKTEIVVTANFREWKHIFNLRTSPKAHPQMREIMLPLREAFRNLFSVVFE